MNNSSSEEIALDIDGVVAQLRLLAIKFERNSDRAFKLQNGIDLSDLIPKLKTEEDVIKLAQRILDGTIPSETGPYHDFEEEMKTYKESNEDEAEDLECDDMDEAEDPNRQALIDLFISNGYHNMWDTWFECFEYFGYEAPRNLKAYEMPNVYELPHVFEETYNAETFDVPAYFKIFIEGNADASTLMTIVDAIVAYYIEDKEEMNTEELEEEERKENKHDIRDTRYLVEDAINMLYEALSDGKNQEEIPLIKGFVDELEEHADDAEAMMEIYEEVDAELDKLDDAKFDSFEQCCNEDCEETPCDVHDDEVDDEIKPYPLLYKATGFTSRQEWLVKKRRLFDEVDIPIQEIRVEQAETDLLLDSRAVKRIALEIIHDFHEGNYHFEDDALEVLQTAAEAYLIETFEKATTRAVKANRTYIGIQDMRSTV